MKYFAILLFSLTSHAQDTIYSAKSVNIGHTVHAYVIQKITKSDTTYIRTNNRDEIPVVLAKSKSKDYPKNLLVGREVYQYHLRRND